MSESFYRFTELTTDMSAFVNKITHRFLWFCFFLFPNHKVCWSLVYYFCFFTNLVFIQSSPSAHYANNSERTQLICGLHSWLMSYFWECNPMGSPARYHRAWLPPNFALSPVVILKWNSNTVCDVKETVVEHFLEVCTICQRITKL